MVFCKESSRSFLLLLQVLCSFACSSERRGWKEERERERKWDFPPASSSAPEQQQQQQFVGLWDTRATPSLDNNIHDDTGEKSNNNNNRGQNEMLQKTTEFLAFLSGAGLKRKKTFLFWGGMV